MDLSLQPCGPCQQHLSAAFLKLALQSRGTVQQRSHDCSCRPVHAHDNPASAPLSMSSERTPLLGPEPGLPRARSRGGQLLQAAGRAREESGSAGPAGSGGGRSILLPRQPVCTCQSLELPIPCFPMPPGPELSLRCATGVDPSHGPGPWAKEGKEGRGPRGKGVGEREGGLGLLSPAHGRRRRRRRRRRRGDSESLGAPCGTARRPLTPRTRREAFEPCRCTALSWSVRPGSLPPPGGDGGALRGRERLEVGTGGQVRNGGRSRIAPPSLPSGPSSAGRAGALRLSQAQGDSDNAGRVGRVRVILVRPGPGPTRTPRRPGGVAARHWASIQSRCPAARSTRTRRRSLAGSNLKPTRTRTARHGAHLTRKAARLGAG
jgi:hypothetical protein